MVNADEDSSVASYHKQHAFCFGGSLFVMNRQEGTVVEMACGLYGIVRRCGAKEPLGRRGQPNANIVDFDGIEEKFRIYRLLSSVASLIKIKCHNMRN